MIRAVALCLLLAGCAEQHFVLGPVVPAPQGCLEARTRGNDC